jgi:hypothetical protein
MGEIQRQGKRMVQNKMIKTIIMFLLLFGSNVHAIDLGKYYKEELSDTDKKAIMVFNILQGIDMLQTLEIANNDNYYEKNKIMGKHPSEVQVISYFIARGFAHYHATKMIPAKYRPIWHTYNVVYNYDVIRNNHSIGIRIDF